jgi:LacI family transcriptional regulator
MATIKDVAALAGISYTTVSHVINNTRPVNAETRRKVEAAITQLDYVPSAVARSLKGQATATIGLLVPNSLNPYFAELARGIEDECERNGYCVILCNSDDDPAKQRKYLRVLLEKRIDGLIVASATEEGGFDDGIAPLRIPLVLVDRELDGVVADRVWVDHEQGGYLATQHLLSLGHRRIACISGPLRTRVAALRVQGYRRAMAEAAIEVPDTWLEESDFTSPGGYQAASRLLESVRPSAIFASNDLLGIGALRAAAERGLRVPQALSVIGFDDIQMSRYVYPALSTVGQSILQLGELAAQLLLQRIESLAPAAPEPRILAPQLLLRESTQAPGPHLAGAPTPSPQG